MTFHFGQLIAHIAKTRNVRAGSIVGSGTVSNKGVGERQRQEQAHGNGPRAIAASPKTLHRDHSGRRAQDRFMQFGDTIRIEMKGKDGQSIFGAIDQNIALPGGSKDDLPEAQPLDSSED